MNNSYYSRFGWLEFGATAYQIAPENNEGSLYIGSPNFPPSKDAKPNYNVLSTDYDNYTVVYSCYDMTLFSMEYLWILAKDYTLSDDLLQTAYGVIQEQLPHYDIDRLLRPMV